MFQKIPYRERLSVVFCFCRHLVGIKIHPHSGWIFIMLAKYAAYMFLITTQKLFCYSTGKYIVVRTLPW